MNNEKNYESNYESNKGSLEEQSVKSNQEKSEDTQMPIDHNMNTLKDEIPKEFRAVEHKTEELQSENFDPGVYYSCQQGNEENNEQNRNQFELENKDSLENRKISFLGQPMRKLNLPNIKSKEEARKAFYGQNVNYYEKYYLKLQETKKKISWNWAAFFLNVYWFFSRKMYAYGLLTMVCKAMFTVVGYNIYDNITNANMQTLLVPWAIGYILVDIGIGMFSNYLYISHMESKIVYPGETELSSDDLAKVIAMRGGFTLSGVLMCFLLSDLAIYGLQYVMTLF